MTDEKGSQKGSTPSGVPAPESRGKQGRLRVFLGMAPGVGKTSAMLQVAAKEKSAGREVLIAAARGHSVNSIDSPASHLPSLPERSDGGIDLDQILARHPEVVVLDELARANPPEARHPKRFQDAQELLEAGIDVFTTLNIYEIASRADLLWPIAGIPSRDIVPDGLIDRAEIILVDMTPGEVRRRRKVESENGPEAVPEKSLLIKEESLLALREMTARLFAERAARDAQEQRNSLNVRGPARSSHRVLVAVEAGWDSEPLILWTRRLAGSLNAKWIVLYVETSRRMTVVEEARLTRNLDLARELGAEVITTADDVLAQAVLRVAQSQNVTQIVLGNPGVAPWWRIWRRQWTLARLLRTTGEIGVHVVPLARSASVPPLRRTFTGAGWQQYAIVIASVLATALAGWIFMPRVSEVGAHAMAFLSLLVVLILALFVQTGPALVAAALSAAIWDYFFLPPVFAFRVSHVEDALLLMMYFVVALALGQLTTRIRAQEVAERQREGRATALYLLGRELAEVTTADEIAGKVVEEVGRSMGAEVAVLLPDSKNGLQAQKGGTLELGEKELSVAAWVLEHRQPAGKFTGNLPMIDSLLIPLQSSNSALGVLAVRFGQPAPPTIHQRNLLEALTRQIALALDRQRLRELSENARLLAESERMGKMLLDSMSHEIRTPVAAIKAAAGDLAGMKIDGGPASALIGEIQEAAERLNGLVGKVLDMTRLESGHIKPLLNECEVNDIINLAVAQTEHELARHKVKVEIASNLPIIRTDFVFLQQSVMNLLSNAAFHTPPGTQVELRAWLKGDTLCITVADDGPGIEPESLPRIFDKFFRGTNARTGGTGLGLSLVKGFVETIGGKVTAENRATGGAAFTISLPVSI